MAIISIALASLLFATQDPASQPTSAPSSQPVEKVPPAPIVEHVPAEKVIASFLSSATTNTSYPESARTFITNSGKSSTQSANDQDFINNSLAVLSKQFASGLDSVDKEKPAEAAEEFARLAESDDPFLATNS